MLYRTHGQRWYSVYKKSTMPQNNWTKDSSEIFWLGNHKRKSKWKF